MVQLNESRRSVSDPDRNANLCRTFNGFSLDRKHVTIYVGRETSRSTAEIKYEALTAVWNIAKLPPNSWVCSITPRSKVIPIRITTVVRRVADGGVVGEVLRHCVSVGRLSVPALTCQPMDCTTDGTVVM